MEITFIIVVLIALIAIIVMAFLLVKKNPKQIRLTELESNYKLLESRHSELESNYKNLESKSIELESKSNLVEKENISLKTNLSNREERLQEEKEKSSQLSLLLEQETAKSNSFLNEKTALKASYDALQEKQKDIKREFEELQKNAKLEFEKTANEILNEKSSKFTETNKNNIETLLKPLDISIKEFRENVNKNLTEETKQRTSLEAEIKKIMEQTNLVSQQANNLASALKGENKKAGNWGEKVLETILQNSGLEKDIHYITQDVNYNEENKKIIPDVIVNLPNERKVIIDSKVSLVAYDNYFSSETEEKQNNELTKHIASLRHHINELSQKKYEEIKGSLDFVMMFVPIESAFLIAMQNDRELWDFAFNKKIVLVSSTTLMSSLKIFAHLWRTDKLNKNYEKIMDDAGKMYDKFMVFLETFENIGERINKADETYKKAYNQLKDGRGNLIKQAQDIKDLGVKTMKTLPEKFEDFDQ
jgi:DNA recombination protein RmuC